MSERDVKIAGARESVTFRHLTPPSIRKAGSYGEIEIKIETFDVIYKLSNGIENTARERTPKFETEETSGLAK